MEDRPGNIRDRIPLTDRLAQRVPLKLGAFCCKQKVLNYWKRSLGL